MTDIRLLEDLRNRHVEPAAGESKRWNKRIDTSVDNIAHALGIQQIPYGNKSIYGDYYSRYLAAYRLEMLERAIKENGVSI
jgi:hypothetical protein